MAILRESCFSCFGAMITINIRIHKRAAPPAAISSTTLAAKSRAQSVPRAERPSRARRRDDFFMLALVVSRLQEIRRRDTGESLERLSLHGASWSVGRSTRGAARNGQRQERRPARPNQCKSSSLCVSITTSEVGLAVPASEKRRGSEASRPAWPSGTPGQPSRAQGRPSPEEAGRAAATAALSQRRRC